MYQLSSNLPGPTGAKVGHKLPWVAFVLGSVAMGHHLADTLDIHLCMARLSW